MGRTAESCVANAGGPELCNAPAAAAHARAKLCRARGEASGAQEGSGLEVDRVWAQLVVADQVGFRKCITISQCPVLPRRAEARFWLALMTALALQPCVFKIHPCHTK